MNIIFSIIFKTDENNGNEITKTATFPLSSIFEETDVCPQSLHTSEPICATTQIPSDFRSILPYCVSSPVNEDKLLNMSKTGDIDVIMNRSITAEAAREIITVYSGLYSLRIMMTIEATIPKATIENMFISQIKNGFHSIKKIADFIN